MFSGFDHLIVTRWYPTTSQDSERTSAISSLVRTALNENFKVLVLVAREDVNKLSVVKISDFETVVTLPWSRKPNYYLLLKAIISKRFLFFKKLNKNYSNLMRLKKLLGNLQVKSCTVHGNLFTHGFLLDSLGISSFNFVCHEADVKSKDTRIGIDFFQNRIQKIGFRSSSIKQKIVEKYSTLTDIPSFVVRSGIPDGELSDIAAYKGYSEKKEVKLVTVARLIKRKNIDKTIKYLASMNLNWTLDVYGSGPELKSLISYARKLGVSDRVSFNGKIPRDKLIEDLQLFDVFVLISENETLGLCYLEALSKGLFVIGSAGEGIADYIEDGVNGLLIDPNSSLEFENALTFYSRLSGEQYSTFKENIYSKNLALRHELAAEHYVSVSSAKATAE